MDEKRGISDSFIKPYICILFFIYLSYFPCYVRELYAFCYYSCNANIQYPEIVQVKRIAIFLILWLIFYVFNLYVKSLMLFYVDIYALELFAILFDRSVNPLSWANVVVSNVLVLLERINPILLMTTSVYQKFRLKDNSIKLCYHYPVLIVF